MSGMMVSSQTIRLGDVEFAQRLCQAWNRSSLKRRLGDKKIGGSNWINISTNISKVPQGYQKIVSGRADCKGWPKFELVIERQPDGTAKCTSAGAYNGTKLTWQFLPTTEGWFEYARSFGMGAFYSLWRNGMRGNKGTAWSNSGNFKIFFQLAANIGLKSDWQSGCSGVDKEDVQEAIDDLKKAWKRK